MKLYFGRGNRRLIIDTQGAVIESFQEKDEEIFYDRRQIRSGKMRGGSHVCYPNFGIDTVMGLPSHGFARDVLWDVVTKDDFSVILTTEGEKNYNTAHTFLVYELLEDGLQMSLTVTNMGDEKLVVAPGFHPYFATKNHEIQIDGKDFSHEKLDETIFLTQDKIYFTAGEKSFQMTGENIHKFAVWTDYEGDYVCVEPTYCANAFRPGLKHCAEILPGKTFRLRVKLTVR